MSEKQAETTKDVLLDDPLSNETRKERRLLLGVSLLGIAMVKAGIVPKKISALGIDLELANQRALLYLVSFVTVYFILAFSIYAASDYIAWRKRVTKYYAENVRSFFKRVKEPDGFIRDNEPLVEQAEKRERFWKGISPFASNIRVFFEFILPLLVSSYAVYLLINLACKKAM